jgi:hypothetical protein
LRHEIVFSDEWMRAKIADKAVQSVFLPSFKRGVAVHIAGCNEAKC